MARRNDSAHAADVQDQAESLEPPFPEWSTEAAVKLHARRLERDATYWRKLADHQRKQPLGGMCLEAASVVTFLVEALGRGEVDALAAVAAEAKKQHRRFLEHKPDVALLARRESAGWPATRSPLVRAEEGPHGRRPQEVGGLGRALALVVDRLGGARACVNDEAILRIADTFVARLRSSTTSLRSLVTADLRTCQDASLGLDPPVRQVANAFKKHLRGRGELRETLGEDLVRIGLHALGCDPTTARNVAASGDWDEA